MTDVSGLYHFLQPWGSAWMSRFFHSFPESWLVLTQCQGLPAFSKLPGLWSPRHLGSANMAAPVPAQPTEAPGCQRTLLYTQTGCSKGLAQVPAAHGACLQECSVGRLVTFSLV